MVSQTQSQTRVVRMHRRDARTGSADTGDLGASTTLRAPDQRDPGRLKDLHQGRGESRRRLEGIVYVPRRRVGMASTYDACHLRICRVPTATCQGTHSWARPLVKPSPSMDSEELEAAWHLLFSS